LSHNSNSTACRKLARKKRRNNQARKWLDAHAIAFAKKWTKLWKDGKTRYITSFELESIDGVDDLFIVWQFYSISHKSRQNSCANLGYNSLFVQPVESRCDGREFTFAMKQAVANLSQLLRIGPLWKNFKLTC
jgi:hypothetical protein